MYDWNLQVELWRDQRRGRLTVDDILLAEGRSEGSSRSINVATPFYIGGMTPETAAQAANNLDVSLGHDRELCRTQMSD